ncbi:putative transcription factor WD40-like family [Helianthus annuus]|uniref:Putative WD40/YVTN repeat-like-containing domain-containing protein n=1 Tax=Helianthus annuus TaxID=4232 RepID=A0A251RUU5_HELAN|nr:putative transcription factor WD40-like family [Helianthus annuus]
MLYGVLYIVDINSKHLIISKYIVICMIVVEGSGLVRRIGLAGKLIGHEDWVNTIEFNRCGDRLVSGSDDMLWNVASKALVLSGHARNVLQARIMPFTNDTLTRL